MRGKTTIAVGLALGLLLLGRAWTGAQPEGQQGGKGVPLPEGLRQVPPDGMGFVYVRVDKFFESKLGQALKKDLLRAAETKEAIKKLESELGLAIKNLESVTLVSLEPMVSGRRVPPGEALNKMADELRKFDDKGGKPIFEPKKFIEDELKREKTEKPKLEPEEKKGPPTSVSFQQEEHFVGMERSESYGPLGSDVVVIVTAKEPLDRKKLLKQLMFGGGPPGPKVPPSFLFLSERSLALGDPKSLVRFADAGTSTTITTKAGKEFGGGFGGGRLVSPLNSLQGAMALAKDNHVLVAGFRMPAALKKQFIAQLDRMDGMPRPEVTFFPLLNVAWTGLTVDLEKEGANLQFHLRGRNMRGAELAAESAKAGLTMLELAIDMLEKVGKKSADSAWLPAVKKALASAKIGRQGNMVNLEMHADLDQKMIQLAIAEITDKVKLSAGRQVSQNNLKQIALAMHNYHDAYRGFPPAALMSKDKKPLLSWRVAILPFIEQAPLYQRFKLDEPWDSEHNKKLIPLMPSIYADPRGKNKEPGMTYYQVFVGPGTVFEPMNRGPLANIRIPNDIPDGTSNTILAVEAGKPVIWTKPDDLPFSEKAALPPLGGLFPDGFNAALCDGSVRFIRRTVPASTLRLLIIRNDGNPIPDY
jgi:hypothetical protein